MPNKNNYHELNYQDNSLHYRDFIAGGKSVDMARTWLDADTVDAWRHRRMYCALDPLLEEESSSWLTIGDGRYGKDSRYISEKGGNVLATDIDDSLLKEAKDIGFIAKFSKENAESLSFGDATFDYVFCKESYHHFPRPMLALYEMLRVASKGVVLIEPNDQFFSYSVFRNISVQMIDRLLSLLHKGIFRHSFEEFGNYVYTISRRELEKAALGMNYRYLAFKGLNDSYLHGAEFEKASENGRILRKIKAKIFLLDLLVRFRLVDYGMMVAILFKEAPSESLWKQLEHNGYDLIELPENPNSHGWKR
jgi:ubiquinone/menaquinone biosynthesis C-methylase UbiE